MVKTKETPNKIDDVKVEETPIKEGDVVIESDKQFTVFHTIGVDPEFYVSSGDDYKLATIDIQSLHTGEVYAHPVVFVIDKEADTMDMIPFGAVAKLRYNWGYAEESKQFANNLAEFQKKTDALDKKAAKKKNGGGKVGDAVKPKENEYLHQYG